MQLLRNETLRTIALVLVAVLAITSRSRAEETLAGVAADLEKAKVLYERASFADAIVLLQDAVRRLETVREAEGRRLALSDAYLHLALAELGAGERGEAKAAFRRLVRLDPERRLDPEIYAPKVLALLEEARAEIVAEAPIATVAPARRGGSKALLIGGLASAVAGGAALALASGGGSPPPAAPIGSPNEIQLLGLSPAPGSTVRLSANPVLVVQLQVVQAESGSFMISINELSADGANRSCLGVGVTVALTGGQPAVREIRLGQSSLSTGACRSEYEMEALEVWLRRMPDFQTADYRVIPARYRIVP